MTRARPVNMPPSVALRKGDGGLPCPKCAGTTQVTDSRLRNGQIRRRRLCVDCGWRFSTRETLLDEDSPALLNAAEALRDLATKMEAKARSLTGREKRGEA